jgi:hypothetical protein
MVRAKGWRFDIVSSGGCLLGVYPVRKALFDASLYCGACAHFCIERPFWMF